MFYFVAAYQGKICTQAVDLYGNPHPTFKVFDGTSWSNWPKLTNSVWPHKPIVYANRLLTKDWPTTGASGVQVFDGTTAQQALTAVYDYAIDSNLVYVPYGDGTVKRTKTLFRGKLSPAHQQQHGVLPY